MPEGGVRNSMLEENVATNMNVVFDKNQDWDSCCRYGQVLDIGNWDTRGSFLLAYCSLQCNKKFHQILNF